LLPQSFYYTYAYSRVKDRSENVYFSVPSGNLGNLCGGLLAKKMGIPIARFIAASNANDIVPHYLGTNNFIPKASVQTISNAMDVGNPSNFARLLDLYDHDYQKIFTDIKGISFDDDETRVLISEVYEKHGYLMCPHTAIGYGGLKYNIGKEDTGIFISTAHPCKFIDIVEPLISDTIEIPTRLQKIVNRKKYANSMKNSFADFKSFLFQSN